MHMELNRPTLLLKKLPNISAGPYVVLSNMLWIDLNRPRDAPTVEHPLLSNRPSISCQGSCQFLGQGQNVLPKNVALS
jgi:hypothetical protein